MNYNRMGVPHKKVSGTLFKGILSRSTLDKCGQATKSGRSFQNAFFLIINLHSNSTSISYKVRIFVV